MKAKLLHLSLRLVGIAVTAVVLLAARPYLGSIMEQHGPIKLGISLVMLALGILILIFLVLFNVDKRRCKR